MLREAWVARLGGRLQIRLLMLIGLAFVSIVGADAINLYDEREVTLAAARTETSIVSRGLAEQMQGMFLTLDTVLLGLRERVETDGIGAATLPRMRNFLHLRLESLGFLHNLFAVDAQGQVSVASRDLGPEMSLAGDPSLRAMEADPQGGLFLGWPSRDKLDGTWVLPVLRRVNHPDGSFAGAVVASVRLDYLRSLFRPYQVGATGMLLLARQDGVMIARWPADPRGEAVNLTHGDMYRQLTGLRDGGGIRYTSSVDGVLRLASVHRLAGLPAYMVVGRGERDVLAGWSATALAHVLGVALLLIVIAALSGRLLLKIGETERAQAVMRTANSQLAKSERAAIRANASLQMAEQMACLGHWQLSIADPVGVRWSEEIYRIHGVDPARFIPELSGAINAYHPEDRDLVQAAVAGAIRAAKSFEFTARIVRPDGDIRHVLSRGLSQTGDDGQVATVFGVLLDITDQKRGEIALRAANDHATAANAALQDANRALDTMAMQDGLTGLANRRRFDRTLDAEFRRAVRGETSLALVMIDVDHFKQFNDRYGHPAGDECLRAITAVLPTFLNRPGDVAARYGGEELAIILPGNSLAGAMEMAERVAAAIRGLAIPHEGSTHGVVTISVGVEAFVPVRDRDTLPELVAHADAAMYAAKRAGRDRVMAFGCVSRPVAVA